MRQRYVIELDNDDIEALSIIAEDHGVEPTAVIQATLLWCYGIGAMNDEVEQVFQELQDSHGRIDNECI